MKQKFTFFKAICFLWLDWICLQIIVVVFQMFLTDYFSWKKLEFEYIGETEFNGITEGETLKGTAPLGGGGIMALEYALGRKCITGFWFYEVRNEQEWEYFSSMLDIQENDIKFDFNSYYVISINRELNGLQYNNTRWDIEKYGSSVRPDFNLDKFEDGKIYIYRLKNNITFYYNDRDWYIHRYNLDRRTFFVDSLFGEDGYEPFGYDYEAVDE